MKYVVEFTKSGKSGKRTFASAEAREKFITALKKEGGKVKAVSRGG